MGVPVPVPEVPPSRGPIDRSPKHVNSPNVTTEMPRGSPWPNPPGVVSIVNSQTNREVHSMVLIYAHESTAKCHRGAAMAASN